MNNMIESSDMKNRSCALNGEGYLLESAGDGGDVWEDKRLFLFSDGQLKALVNLWVRDYVDMIYTPSSLTMM